MKTFHTTGNPFRMFYILILGLFVLLVSSSLNAQIPTLTIGTKQACPDSKVEIPVTSGGHFNVGTFDLEIEFEKDGLEFIRLTNIYPAIAGGNLGYNYSVPLQRLFVSFWVTTSIDIPAGTKLFDIEGTYKGGSVPLTFDTDNSEFTSGSKIATNFINGEITPILEITTHPVDVTVDGGDPAHFSVTANPPGSPTTYQWQRNTGSGWTDLADNAGYSGTTTQDLTKTTTDAADNGNQYRVVVENGDCTITSDEATLSISGIFLLTLQSEPPDGGTTEGGGSYLEDEVVNITATENIGYAFVEWKEDDVYVSDDAAYSYTMPGHDVTLTAHFEARTHTITATAGAGGSISPEGTVTVDHGDDQTFTIEPGEGYEIDDVLVNGFSEGAIAEYTFSNVTENHTIEASFKKKTYTITASAGPGGSISPSGTITIEHGDDQKFDIEVDADYEIDDVLVNGISQGAIAEYTFTNVTANQTIEASFKKKTYTITASAGPGGSISPSGTITIEHGDDQTFTIEANEGYEIDDVLVEGASEGAIAEYTFTNVTANQTIHATFAINQYTIAATPDPAAGGSIDGTRTYNHGQSVTLTANPEAGYEFLYWSEGGDEVPGAGAIYTFTATENRTLIAHFTLSAHTITATAGDNGEINPSGEVLVDDGDDQVFTIIPNLGFGIDDVEINGTPIDMDTDPAWDEATRQYTFTDVTSDQTIHAAFAFLHYVIDATVEPVDAGTVTGTGNYDPDEEVTLIATPNPGYDFLHWTEDDVIVEVAGVPATATYTFNATENRNLTAHFDPIIYTINAVAFPVAGGTVTGTGTYEPGEEVTLIATPNPGYNFLHWTEDGDVVEVAGVPATATYTFIATENRNLTAHFDPITYTINAVAFPVAGGTVTGTGTYDPGEVVTLIATPNPGYNFLHWTEDGDVVEVAGVPATATYTFTAEKNRNLTAHFDPHEYTITVTAEPIGWGTVSGTGVYQQGEMVTATATPEHGYGFVHWKEDDVVVAGAPATYEFMAERNRDLVAHFTNLFHTITATAGPGGLIDPAGTVTVTHGANQTFLIEPDEGYRINRLLVNNFPRAVVSQYTFEAVNRNHTIEAQFAKKSYTIEASAGTGGSIDPSGTIELQHGEDKTFTITPNPSYLIDEVLVDGTPIDMDTDDRWNAATNEYTFEDVTDNHTIHALFKRQTYVINATAGAGGSINPSGAVEVIHGTNQTFTIEADDGFEIDNVAVDGLTEGAIPSHTFTNVTASHTIHASFVKKQYTLLYIAGDNGTIDGDTEQTVDHGDDGTSVEAMPDDGYHFVEWSDGSTDNPRIDTNVEDDITVTALFEINTYTLIYIAGDNGTIDGDTEQTVDHGDDGTSVEAMPDDGYHFVEWSDGETENPRTDTNVEDDITVTALFDINTYTLTYTAGDNGTVNGEPELVQVVEHGSDGTAVQAIPDDGYHFVEWSDGRTENPRTDTNVQDDITVTAHFEFTVFDIHFVVRDNDGADINDAVVTLSDEETYEQTNDPGDYSFAGLTPGTYRYEVNRDNFYRAQGQVVLVDKDVTREVRLVADPTSVYDHDKQHILVYPNPARDRITIEAEQGFTEIRMIDVLGQTIYHAAIEDKQHVVDVSGWQPGLYFVQIISDQQMITRKVQVSR